MPRKFKCSLPNITCFNCVEPADNALRASDLLKIASVSVDIHTKIATIIVDNDDLPNEEIIIRLTEIISDVGVSCEDFEEVVPIVIGSEKKLVKTRKKISPLVSNLIKAGIGIVSGAVIMGLMLSGIAIPAIAMYVMIGVTSALTLALGARSYKEAVVNLVKSRTWTMDVLYTVSTLAIVGTNIASIFFPFMPMMLDAGLLIFGFKFGGKALEEYIRSKTTQKLTLAERAATKVWRRLENGDWVLCDASDIKVGDIIRVNHSEKIPVNGVLESESAWIGEGIEDGSTKPKYATQGKIISAGMSVPKKKNKYGENSVVIRVTHTRDNSYYAHLENARDLINKQKSSLENKAQSALKFLVPVAVAAAVVSGVLLSVFMGPSVGFHFATSLLVSLCPCTLGVLTPTSMALGMKKAENHGVRFKDTSAVEQAANIDIVVFDVTGTLSMGKPVVRDYEYYDEDETDTDRYFGIVASIQRKGRHIFAHKIASFVEKKMKEEKEYEVTDVDHSQNTGIKATVEGDVYLIGNSRFLKFHNIDFVDNESLEGVEQITYVVKNNRVIGRFKIEDPLRPDADFVVKELRRMGKEIRICTGASEAVALRYAAALKIPPEHVHADCVGREIEGNERTKVKYIESLQAGGKRAAMIGDGGNDALALEQSKFGLALNSTATDPLAYESAGATVPNATLLPVVTSFVVAEQTMRSAKQNLIFSLAYNLATILILGGILIGIGFAINPAIGVALMVVQASLILLNQYRIYKQKMPHIKRYEQSLKNDFRQDDSSPDMFRRRGLVESPELRAEKRKEGAAKGVLSAEKQPLISSSVERVDALTYDSDLRRGGFNRYA